MSRIDPTRFRTSPNHFETASKLLIMLIDLKATVNAGESVGVVQREQIVTTITAAVDELSKCCGDLHMPCSEALIKRYNKHGALVRVLNEIKGDLDKRLHWIDFVECRQMVNQLDECRSERAAW